MGMRFHIVKEYKVKYLENGGFFNNDFEGLLNLLNSLDIDYNADCSFEGASVVEVFSQGLKPFTNERIKKLDINDEQKQILRELRKVAKQATYAKDGYVRVEFF